MRHLSRLKTIHFLFLLVLLLLCSLWISSLFKSPSFHASPSIYSYRLLKSYPHDRRAFTQGLVFSNGYLYEGTGLAGFSSLRKVDLQTGKILKIRHLPPYFFGEGITIWGDRIFQLTYTSQTGFVYDRDSFALIKEFHYANEGWGITNDGRCLIMSDGTSTLHFLDPETFRELRTINVHDYRGNIAKLNELEFVRGKILANIWQEDRLAEIDPATGAITGWIELPALLRTEDRDADTNVLNGIAYDPETNHLFVTGKLWPKLFEIELVRKE
jgi:glutaminyl-peptide cyclotransferase